MRLVSLVRLMGLVALAPIVLLFPRNRKKILFGAWWGNSVSDNSKYFLHYVLENLPEYQCYWVGKKSLREEVVKIPNVRFVRKESALVVWHMLTASWAFWTISLGDDISQFPTFGRIKQLSFWHGPIFKDVTYLAHASAEAKPLGLFSRLRLWVRAFREWAYTQKAYASFSTETAVKRMKYEAPWSFDESRSRAFGTARIDYLIKNRANQKEILRVREKYAKILSLPLDQEWFLYMPTWRKGLMEKYSTLRTARISEIQSALEKRNAILIEKQHPQVLFELGLSAGHNGRIYSVSKEQSVWIDTQELLLACQRLVTDYSSCSVDFMVLNRPVIYFMYDYDFYLKERGLAFDLNEFAAGPVAKDEVSFIKLLGQTSAQVLAQKKPRASELYSGEKGHACEQFAKWVGLA